MKKTFIRSAALAPLVFLLAPLALFGSGRREPPAPLPQATMPAAEPSLEEMFDGGHWITRPSGSVITIIGITGRRMNRDAAVQEALADAARKAALYHGVHAKSAIILHQGQGLLDYYSNFDYEVAPENSHEAYIDALAFDKETDILEKNGLVIVRTKYRGVSDIPPYGAAIKDGVPEWVTNLTADIPGFLAGIGYSKNKGTVPKTYASSYESAIVSLLPQLSTQVAGEDVDAGGGRLTSSAFNSEGRLVNVMILETWYEKNTSSVWTLLAAKEKR
ncbi:MAG: hypothetical protein LBJ86_05315 [Spirochaetaceae bacterium]|jgi:hypothetical protein|nr:hypothetical protein [Spirochaetaceae bacterium]